MASPVSLTQAQFNGLKISTLNNMSTTSNLMGSNFYLSGMVSGTNQIAFYADVQGTPSLSEASTLNLNLNGVDLSKGSTRFYFTYDIGMDPVKNMWTVVITGSAGNTCKFKKAGVGGDGVRH